jgi:hypothetical protein
MQREIQNPQMFETDPGLSPFPQPTTTIKKIETSQKEIKWGQHRLTVGEMTVFAPD